LFKLAFRKNFTVMELWSMVTGWEGCNAWVQRFSWTSSFCYGGKFKISIIPTQGTLSVGS
jgi:hypothetical protein